MNGFGRTIVLICVLGIAGACSSGGDGVPPQNVTMSAQITADTVGPVLAGDEDFAGAAAALQEAIDLDPNNNAAKFFQAVFNYLAFLKLQLLPPPPQVVGDPPTTFGAGLTRNLLFDAGYENVNENTGMLRDVCFLCMDRGEGLYANTFPGSDAFQQAMRDHWLPAHVALNNGLNSVGAFQFEGIADAPLVMQPTTLRFDRGDALLLRSWSLSTSSCIRWMISYDWDDVEPNPILDCVDDPMLSDKDFQIDRLLGLYPNIGTLVDPQQQQTARTELQTSFSDYQAGANIILNENQTDRDLGVLTSQFTPEEFDCYRTVWHPGILLEGGNFVNAATNMNTTYTPSSLLVPTGWEFTLNPYYFFNGTIDFNAIYVNSIIDPRTNWNAFGVNAFDDYSQDFRTVGNALVDPQFNVGDFQVDCYLKMAEPMVGPGFMLRLDDPFVGSKTVDGDITTDWGANTYDRITDNPFVKVEQRPRPDLGAIDVASSGNGTLYMRLTQDPTPFINEQPYDIRVQTDTSFLAIFYDLHSEQFASQQSGGTVSFVHTPNVGIEASFTPTQPDSWAFVSTLVDNIQSDYIAAIRINPDE